MRWLERNTMSVLVLDGSERLGSFPRLAIFAVDGGGWSACVIAAPGRRAWLGGAFRTQGDAKRACLKAARAELPRRWHPAIDAAVAALGGEPAPTQGGAREAPREVPSAVAPARRGKR